MERVIGQLKGLGYVLDEDKDTYYLRVTPMEETKRDEYKSLSFRLDIEGLDAIQQYCRTNTIPLEEPNQRWRFTEKQAPTHLSRSTALFADFNYSVSFKIEKHYFLHVPETKRITDNWGQYKKLFRLIKRCRFRHRDDSSIFVDVSIVKTNKNGLGVPIPAYTTQESGVLTSEERFEIELEANNELIFQPQSGKSTIELMNVFRHAIYNVLSALQDTRLPIPHQEQDHVLKEYIRLVYTLLKPKVDITTRKPGVSSTDFLGPSSMTLQLENVASRQMRNHILDNYAVTDKADGERKLLFVCPMDNSQEPAARIYLIDVNMNVTFTGKTTTDKKYFYTLMDGEHVVRDLRGNVINLYLAFDIYFAWSNEEKTVISYCNSPFFKTKHNSGHKFRYSILKEYMREWSQTTSMPLTPTMTLQVKEFIHKTSIFEASGEVLHKSKFVKYPTDGLIYTPCDLTVPVQPGGHTFKVSWEKSFKWKPPQYNTIDFFVSVRKNKDNHDCIQTTYQNGINLTAVDADVPHKVIELHCGYNEQKHRFMNPFVTLLREFLHDKAGTTTTSTSTQGYTHQKFQPTCPYLPNAYLAYIPLVRNDWNEWEMKTESGDIFTEGMIVEFAYDTSVDPTDNLSAVANSAWRWKPLRVRYDKTANLLSGQKEYGNAFHVADSIWHSIHFPLTESIITTGKNITIENTEVYYEKQSNRDVTYRLRKFHNFVKRQLIDVVAGQSNKTLIDFAVGKAGDLNKWIQGEYNFVLGIDVSRDNIMNSNDGACVRYLKEKERTQTDLRAIFVVGDSSKNIREGGAFAKNSEFQQITDAIMGVEGKRRDELGDFNHRGKEGFAVSSCQFAIHYFFKNMDTLHGFIRNVAENTQLGGYFIGTTYDGETVFNALKSYSRGNGMILSNNGQVYFQLIKQYDETGFPADESSLGYEIDVFQESIGQNIKEYLVHFTFLERVMNMYGFHLVQLERDLPEKHNQIKTASAMFSSFYEQYSGMRMTKGEEKISMMNRFFVFRKTVDVVPSSVYKFVNSASARQYVAQPKPPFRKIRSGYIITRSSL